MEQKKFYITTTLPYVNADPHLGHALEFVQADIIARYKRILGEDVFFNIGTDEHGQKIWNKAQEENTPVAEYVDHYAARFEGFAKTLNISYTNFIRTTDTDHIAAAQEFWKRCDEAGDIYKKLYEVKYCIGCELEKTDSELDEKGYCPDHPSKELDVREEENYFFRFSKYQDKLLSLYSEDPDFVIPKERLNEIKSFTERGLQDFSISRLKEKMPWGVEVPDDTGHVMYVWFDALVNYISAIGWPKDMENISSVLDKIIAKRLGKGTIGFKAEESNKFDRHEINYLLSQVEPEDLVEFGLIPEFIGRFNSIANCNELTEDDLVHILTEPKNAIIKQYIQLFKEEGVELSFTDDALIAIASTGAVVSSVPINIVNVLPQWAEIAMPVAGILNAPGSIRSFFAGRRWLVDAVQKKGILEAEVQQLKAQDNTLIEPPPLY